MTYDLIIIGAGSAGLTAAVYANRKKLNTLILTKQLGGQSLMTDDIENFPGYLKISGYELINKMKEQVDKYGVPIKEGAEVSAIQKEDGGFLIQTKDGEIYRSRAVIIASGKMPKKLDVPGEKEFFNRGVAYCALCDAPLYKDKRVAVIGGGNAAFGSAVDLLNYAAEIYLIHHGQKFIGDELIREKLEKSGKVKFITNAETKKIKGKDFVESVIYEDLLTKEVKELAVGGVFVNIGQIPNTDFVKGFLELNENNEIIIDCSTNAASVKGIFASGDVSNISYKQCVIAAAEGAKAALSAHKYLLNAS